MSALTITVQTLLDGPDITALVGQRIYPGEAPQAAAQNNIVVHLVYQSEEEFLEAASEWPEARVSVECRGADIAAADRIAEAVINWLRNKDRYPVEGCEAAFRKEGTDETNSSAASQQGLPVVARRIVDFYLRYRTL